MIARLQARKGKYLFFAGQANYRHFAALSFGQGSPDRDLKKPKYIVRKGKADDKRNYDNNYRINKPFAQLVQMVKERHLGAEIGILVNFRFCHSKCVLGAIFAPNSIAQSQSLFSDRALSAGSVFGAASDPFWFAGTASSNWDASISFTAGTEIAEVV